MVIGLYWHSGYCQYPELTNLFRKKKKWPTD